MVLGTSALGLELGRTSAGTVPRARHLVIDNPYDGGGSWYKGNLQVASVRGIGRDLPSAIAGWYAAHGYAFLGISDQNTYTWVSEIGASHLIGIPVVDASYPFGDVLAIGDDRWLPADNLQEAINWIAADNTVPVLTPGPDTKSLDDQILLALKHLFGLEIYDARLSSLPPPLAGEGRGGGLETLWDQLLSRGERVYAFAGDDAISLNDPALGQAWIDVKATSNQSDALMSSLRRGAFYASTGPGFTSISVSGKTITVDASDGSTLRFIGKGGRLLRTSAESGASYSVTGEEGYVRIEAIDDHGGHAWSQPLFLVWR